MDIYIADVCLILVFRMILIATGKFGIAQDNINNIFCFISPYNCSRSLFFETIIFKVPLSLGMNGSVSIVFDILNYIHLPHVLSSLT